MGFAPPPYDGFAFLANAHTRMRMPCYEHIIHRLAAPRNKGLAQLPRRPKRRSS
jgi:hypothetical protein